MVGSERHSWNVSLHGGHSSGYCDHARDELPAMIGAAIDRGMPVYGISEHAPRYEERFIYPEETAMGWTLEKIQRDFERYAADSLQYVREYADRIQLLRAFEIEVAPRTEYAARMRVLRDIHRFDYIVGSVHYVNDRLFDHRGMFAGVVQAVGGLENLAVLYYRTLEEMVVALRPEVIAHFDVIRKYPGPDPALETPRVRVAAEQALEAARVCGAILDVNTGAYRRGSDMPYPASWIVRLAHGMGIPFCFGDDSHACADVGADIPRAREYLLEHGVRSIRILVRQGASIRPEDTPLI